MIIHLGNAKIVLTSISLSWTSWHSHILRDVDMVDNSNTYWRCYLLPIAFCHPLRIRIPFEIPVKGFELVKHNTYNTDFPESIYRRNEVNVIVRLNAPITEHKPLTITVIASGKQKKVWTFPANKDEKVFESFELFLQSN